MSGVLTGKLDLNTQALAYQNLVGDGGGKWRRWERP